MLALAWLPIETLLSHLLYDDFFYCLKLAQNLIHRRALSFDGTAPTYVPHPLWVAICTGIQAITDSPIVVHLILTVAAGLHAAQTYVVFRLVSIMTRRHIAHLTAIFYLMNYRLIACSLCGLETPLQALFILLVFHHVLANRGPLGVGSAIRCGGLLGLAVLARIDLLLLAGFVIVWVLIDRSFGERFFRGRLRGAVTICATLLVVALPWSLWSAIRSGTVLPSELVALNLFRFQPFDATHSLAHNLVLLKSKLTLAGWYLSDAANLLGVWPFVHAYDLEGRLGGVLVGLVLGLLGVGIGFTRRSTNHLPRCVMAAYGLAHMGYYVFFAMPEIRYLVPFCIVTILVAASIAGDVSFKLRTVWGSRVGPVVYGVLVIHSAVAGVLAWGQHQGATTTHALHADLYKTAQWVRVHTDPEAILGSWNAGIMGYFSGRTVVNLDGLVNDEAIVAMRQCRLAEYIRHRRIDYLVDVKGQIEHFMHRFSGEPNWRDGYELVYLGPSTMVLRRKPGDLR